MCCVFFNPFATGYLLNYICAFYYFHFTPLQVVEAGGLHVVGTERHESRRIDNQVIAYIPC